MELSDFPRSHHAGNLTKGIGETGNTPAEDYSIRERKQSVVNFSGDPFQQLVGQGHRQSVSGGQALEAANQATERRRSSAVGPNASSAAARATQRSGYDGGGLAPIQSRPELPPVANVTRDRDEITSEGSTMAPSSGASGAGSGGVGSAAPGANGHTNYYDAATTENDHSGGRDLLAFGGTGNQAAQKGLNTGTGSGISDGPQSTTTTTTTTSTTQQPTASAAQQQYEDPDSVAPDERR